VTHRLLLIALDRVTRLLGIFYATDGEELEAALENVDSASRITEPGWASKTGGRGRVRWGPSDCSGIGRTVP
jgi:hypothetical protein